MLDYYIQNNGHENGRSFDDVLALLKAEPKVVLQWSRDGRKETPADNTTIISYFTDWETGLAIDAQLDGWFHLGSPQILKDAPLNNKPHGDMRHGAGYTDYRVKQPALREGMDACLLTGDRDARADFNAAATVLLKTPDVTLTGWANLAQKSNGDMRGAFTIAADSRDAVDALTQKLPGWRASRNGSQGPVVPHVTLLEKIRASQAKTPKGC